MAECTQSTVAVAAPVSDGQRYMVELSVLLLTRVANPFMNGERHDNSLNCGLILRHELAVALDIVGASFPLSFRSLSCKILCKPASCPYAFQLDNIIT